MHSPVRSHTCQHHGLTQFDFVLRYTAFKDALAKKKKLLEDAKKYQYFKRDAGDEPAILSRLTCSDYNTINATELNTVL
mgnify:CR=1 FL=1